MIKINECFICDEQSNNLFTYSTNYLIKTFLYYHISKKKKILKMCICALAAENDILVNFLRIVYRNFVHSYLFNIYIITQNVTNIR